MLSEDEDFSSPLIAFLDKESSKIDEELELQVANSKCSFHHEEICGWTITRYDLNRFRWINNKKRPRTANKDQRTLNTPPRRSFSRQSFRNDIEFEFKHCQHRTSYIEQYRGEKMKRHEAELREYLPRSSPEKGYLEHRESCTRNQDKSPSEQHSTTVITKETRTTESNPSPLVVITSSHSSGHAPNMPNSRHFQGRKLYARPMVYIRSGTQPRGDSSWNKTASDVTIELPPQGPYNTQHRTSSGKESWTVIGIEKRPLPPQRKLVDTQLVHTNKSLSRERTQKSQTHAKQQHSVLIPNKCDAWVKSREKELSHIYDAKNPSGTPTRSSSAPQISTFNRCKDWQGKSEALRVGTSDGRTRASSHNQGGAQNCTTTSIDYSCYTEMFKNVLEYYGTKRLRPDSKGPARTENAHLLSVRT